METSCQVKIGRDRCSYGNGSRGKDLVPCRPAQREQQAPDPNPLGQTDGSAAAARAPSCFHAAGRAWRWPPERIPNRWAGICSLRERASAAQARASGGKSREAPAEAASQCGPGGRRRRQRGSSSGCGARLLQNTHNLGLQFGKFHRQHGAPWMENEIEARGQQVNVQAQRLAQTPLDAIAVMRLAQHLAYGQAYARPGNFPGTHGRLRSQKPAHGCRLLLPCCGIGALKIAVPAQTRAPQAQALRWMGRRIHEKRWSARMGNAGESCGFRRSDEMQQTNRGIQHSRLRACGPPRGGGSKRQRRSWSSCAP